MRKILIRLDDICPKMDHSKFDKFKDLFIKYNVHPIIGVVPDCKDNLLNIDDEDPLFWDKIKDLQKKGWTIAMHGCFHQYVTSSKGLLSSHKRSEFAGLSYEEQLKKIKYGSILLKNKGIQVDVFMAPSHSYDKNTIKALKACGFKYITDGLTNHPYEYMGMIFVPCKESKLIKTNRFSTVCLHTNMATNDRYLEIENYLKKEGNRSFINFYQATEMKKKSYWLSRIEELLFYVKEYYIINFVYILYKKVKKD